MEYRYVNGTFKAYRSTNRELYANYRPCYDLQLHFHLAMYYIAEFATKCAFVCRVKYLSLYIVVTLEK